jgi:hypothetical protein
MVFYPENLKNKKSLYPSVHGSLKNKDLVMCIPAISYMAPLNNSPA